MNFEEVVKLWNNQADKFNRWDSLSADEQVGWAIKCKGNELRRLEGWLKWISAHSVVDAIQSKNLPYINMSPNGAAAAALRGEDIAEHIATTTKQNNHQ